MLAAFQIDKDEEAPGRTDQRKRAFIEFGVVIVVTLTVGVLLGVLIGRSGSGNAPAPATIIDGPPGRNFQFSSAQDRGELVDLIKESSNQEPNAAAKNPVSSVDTLNNQFKVNPADHMRYMSGARRRPTDPATPEEIEVALNLLFGSGESMTLEEANAKAQDPKSWGGINAVLPAHERLYPEYFVPIKGDEDAACKVEKPFGEWHPYNDQTELGPCPTRDQALQEFYQHMQDDGVVKAHEWLRTQDHARASVQWSSVSATTTFVKKSISVNFEDALDRGEEPSRTEFKKYLMVKASGGVVEEKPNGDQFREEAYIVVDVTDPANPATEPSLLDVYHRYADNKFAPSRAGINQNDQGYLLAAIHALYGKDEKGNNRTIFPMCQSDPRNFLVNDCSVRRSWNPLDIRYFIKPFAWKDTHENAQAYGATNDERVLLVMANELHPGQVPMDGNQITAGTFLSPTPLGMFRTVGNLDENGTMPAPRKDPHNKLMGSECIGMTWYGRGLEFTEQEAGTIAASLPGSAGGQNEQVRQAVTAAIRRTWGDEEIYGTRPGALVQKDGVDYLEIVEKHPYKQPEYLNHATPTVLQEAFQREDMMQLRNNSAPHRDMRDNPRWSRPLTNAQGVPQFAPQGKRIETIAVGGPSFKVDGYGVEWDVGLKWRFNIGFELDAGLTLFNLRVVVPPTEEHPNGQVVPYLYKVNIPNFGTAYATSSIGNLFSATFLESHFGAALGAVPGANCRGPHMSFPIFRAKGMTAMKNEYKNMPVYYSSYGNKPDGSAPYEDDYARQVLGLAGLPTQLLALDGRTVSQGIIPDLFCLQESDQDHAMWHLYTAQRQRKLMIFQPTISDAYNILLTYEFFSNGKMTIAERLHGKPAVVNFGLPKVGGAYAARGKGGLATNHVHWVGVNIEPHIKKNQAGVRNALVVEDLAWETDPTNWYGMAFNRVGREVKWSNDTANLKMDYAKNRWWRLAAFDAEGNDLGGLMMKSPSFGPHPVSWDQAPLRWSETEFEARQTFANHWWLYNQDIFMNNAGDTRDRQTLLSHARDSSCFQPSSERCLPPEEIVDSPSIFAIMKLYHAVITDELPVQDGFTQVQVDLWPHNLFDFNPSILTRYMPAYAERFQNNWFHEGEKIYTPPYASEWAEL